MKKNHKSAALSAVKRPDSVGAHSSVFIPSWVLWGQCFCFAMLYSIWYYPHTNLLSDLSMIFGALLSAYAIYINHKFLRIRESAIFWLLLALIIWILIHLLFIGNDSILQFKELNQVWKRAIITMIFAFGFGVSLVNTPAKRGCWIIFLAGMILPALIFYVKYAVAGYNSIWGFSIPDYLKLYSARYSEFYIHKVTLVAFCLPAFAIILAELWRKIKEKSGKIFVNTTYIIFLLLIIILFKLIGSKNGIGYSLILSYFFIYKILSSWVNRFDFLINKGWAVKTSVHLSLLVIVFALYYVVMSFTSLDSYLLKSFADIKVAIKVDENDGWKYWDARNYPLNDNDEQVSPTIYERVSWCIIGFRLLLLEPLGYGLIETGSFGKIAEVYYPGSLLRQSHNGWLDLALSIGIPGAALILFAYVIAISKSLIFLTKNDYPISKSPAMAWVNRLAWVLMVNLLLWSSTEISSKAQLLQLLFWPSLAAGLFVGIRDDVPTQNQ